MDRQEIMLLLQRLRAFSTPELCDGAGLYHSMDYRIKPQISSEKIVGTAVTVDVPTGEGAMVAQAIHHLIPGDILVVAGRGNCNCSYWGDHRSLCAQMAGAAGVVIGSLVVEIQQVVIQIADGGFHSGALDTQSFHSQIGHDRIDVVGQGLVNLQGDFLAGNQLRGCCQVGGQNLFGKVHCHKKYILSCSCFSSGIIISAVAQCVK